MSEDTIKIERPQQDVVPNVVKLAMNSQTLPQAQAPTHKETYPSEPISLPSQGYFYPESNPLCKGTLDIKYMTAKEEDILTSQNLIKKGVVLEKLLESVIVTTGVKIDDLLIGDKNAIFMACRRLAYGDKYSPGEISCPKCSTMNKPIIDLSSIQNKDYDFSNHERGLNLFEFAFPFCKRTVQFKLLTHKDEKEIDKELESLQKVSKTGGSSEITTRLKKMVVNVDGDSNRGTVNKFIDQLPASDSQSFRKYIKELSPDIDSTFEFVCESCGHVERLGVPIGISFFWPEL